MNFPPLSLPPYDNIRLKKSSSGRIMVYDILRRKYISLTPEEWVRQHFVNYLINHLGYPEALLANEVELKVGEKKLRCDSVLFGTDKLPRMIVEYKAADIPITKKVFNQIMSYNTILGVETLIMSNGLQHVVMQLNREENKWQFLPDVPHWESQSMHKEQIEYVSQVI